MPGLDPGTQRPGAAVHDRRRRWRNGRTSRTSCREKRP